MSKLRSLLTVAASVAALGAWGQAHATALFTVEANPSNKDEIKLTEGHNQVNDLGTDDGTNVNITTNDNSEFGSGDATIKPEHGHHLTMLTIDPTNDKEFDDFSFRGQDLKAGSTIKVAVFDQNGVETDFSFVVDKANQDFDRFGIIGAAGETISKVIITNDDGFKEVKQMALSLAPGVNGVPEPATWGMLIVGMGLLGWGLRRERDRRLQFADYA